MMTDNRFIQIAYPIVIFFSLLLAWNSVGQINGFAHFREPDFDQNHTNRKPAQIQTACSPGRLSFLEAISCKEENSQPWKLIGTNELSRGSFGQVAN
jgi:hypothetical protein